MFSTIDASYGFETTKRILGVGTNTLTKLINLNLMEPVVIPGTRNFRYHGQAISELAFARNRPFLIPNEEKALVCSIGIETGPSVPSMYIDATWARNRNIMKEIWSFLSDKEREGLCEGTIRVTGNWGVSARDCEELSSNNSLVVASYAGFILDGARMIREIEGYTPVQGKRAFLVRPLDSSERLTYARTYLLSKQGPVNKVWTAKQLQDAAAEQALADGKIQ